MKVKHICSIKTKLEEHTSKHLVLIHDKHFVFVFNKNNIFTWLHEGDQYFFSTTKHLHETLPLLKEKHSDALDMYDYYTNDKLSDEMYLSIHHLYYDRQKAYDQLNELKSTLKQLSK